MLPRHLVQLAVVFILAGFFIKSKSEDWSIKTVTVKDTKQEIQVMDSPQVGAFTHLSYALVYGGMTIFVAGIVLATMGTCRKSGSNRCC